MLWVELVSYATYGALLGAGVGLATGLVPGLHTNNLAQGLVAARGTFLGALAVVLTLPAIGPESAVHLFSACGFLLGLTLGHAFTDEVPAVFLGAPDPDTALSVLPGHRLLMEGLGPAAVRATALGSLLGVVMSLPLIPLLAGLMGPPLHLYGAAAVVLPYLLLAVAVALVFSEGGSKRLSRLRARALAAGLVLLSGALGEAVIFQGLSLPNTYPLGAAPALNTGFLLALFAGLFGLPTLLLAARSAVALPPGPPGTLALPLTRAAVAKAAAAGTLAGALVGWLPGVGAAQASVLAKLARDRLTPSRRAELELRGPGEAAEFLVTQSAVAAANLVFNLVALFTLLRVRSGTMGAMEQIGAGQVTRWTDWGSPPDLVVALLVATVAVLPLCYAGALGLGGLCARVYQHLPPRALSAGVFAALVLLALLLEGVVGLAVAVCGLTLGMVPPLAGVKRIHLMGAILLPVALRLLWVV